jgi:hypothetical protein
VCDNKGPTLTLIRSSEDYLFGGYSVLSWDSTSRFKKKLTKKKYSQGFIFTLTNPHNIPPTKYEINPQSGCSIYCIAECGPNFAEDIEVCDDSQFEADSIFNFPNCYVDTTGLGEKTFTGTYRFFAKEIAVFSVCN